MKKLLLTSVALMAMSGSAGADILKFFQGSGIGPAPGSYQGPFSGAGTVYRQIQGFTTTCSTTGGTCAGDDVQNIIHYNTNANSGTALDATGLSTDLLPQAIDDYQPNFGGLGVVTVVDSNDQINGTNMLHLQFAHAVTITGLATLFHPDHVDTDGSFGGIGLGQIQNGGYKFDFSEDGSFTDFLGGVSFLNANTINTIAVSGANFYFRAIDGNPDFYVSGLLYSSVSTGQQCANPPCDVSAVPSPIAGAGFPGIVAAMVGLWGLNKRRRNKLAV